MKLTRLIEVLENTIKHFSKEHTSSAWSDWLVSVTPTEKGLTIDIKANELWNDHINDIAKAFKKAKREEIHNF